MASSRSIGSLSLDLILKMGGFTQGMDQAARITDKRMREIEQRAYKFGQTIGKGLKLAASAAAVAFGALTLAVGRSIENADKLDEMSQKLGISAEQLSKWGYAAKLSGTDLEGLNRAIPIFSKNLAAAMDPGSRQANLFTQLGIDIKDAEGNLRSVESLIPEVANVFKTLDNQTTETALSMQLFGKSGAELLEFLNRGQDGITELGDELSDLGGVISNETAASAAEFKDELDRLREAGGGLATQIASGLLPALTDAVEDLRDLIKQGDLAENIITVLTAAIDFGVGVIQTYQGAVRGLSIQFEFLAQAAKGFKEINDNIGIGGLFNEGSIAGGFEKIKQAGLDADAALKGVNKTAKEVAITLPAVTVTGTGKQIADAEREAKRLQDAANRFLTDPSGKGDAKKKAGKTDAERDAERLQKAYESLNERLAEQIALFGQTGEAAKLRYELENGELSKLTETQKAGLLVQAEAYDLMVRTKEEEEELSKFLKEQHDAFEDRMKSNEELIKDMQFELELLGMTNAEREKAIALSYLSADATDEQKRAVSELSDTLRVASENAQFMDDAQRALSDNFADFITGAKSAKEAFGDFADYIFQKAVQLMTDRAVESLFNAFGGGQGGTTGGGGWGDFFSSLFSSGGGRAGGGNVQPYSAVRVNEVGFEMATVNGNDYLLTGSQPVNVTPHNRAGGGFTQVINNNYRERYSARTQQQAAADIAYSTNLALRRNS